MNTTLDNFRERIARKAIVFDIGGFRPSEDPWSSWFGTVRFCKRGEEWPKANGKPMHALAQINISHLPFIPASLQDIVFLTVFIGPTEFPNDDPNGDNWCLRAYKIGDDLVPLSQVDSGSPIKSFPMRPRIVENDFPCWEDLPVNCPEEFENDYDDLFENTDGFKIGGWPSLIQAEIFWAPLNQHPMDPSFVFQIDSTEKGNWAWGDQGVGYFGRGTAPDFKNDWAISWQCL